MTRLYVRQRPGPKETLGALAVALGVGAVSFYFVRMFLGREGLEREAPSLPAKSSGTPIPPVAGDA